MPLVPLLGGGGSALALVLAVTVGVLLELRLDCDDCDDCDDCFEFRALELFEPLFFAALAACFAFRCACATSYPPSAVGRPTGTPSSNPSVVQALFALAPPPLLASDHALAWPSEAFGFGFLLASALASAFTFILASPPTLALALALASALALAPSRPPEFALSRLDVGLDL